MAQATGRRPRRFCGGEPERYKPARFGPRKIGAGVDLTGANFAWVDLVEIDFTGVDASRALLDGANLEGSQVKNYAVVGWGGHGEHGLALRGILWHDGRIELSCGCFSGSPEDLLAFIDTSRTHDLMTSRRKAMRLVLELLKDSP